MKNIDLNISLIQNKIKQIVQSNNLLSRKIKIIAVSKHQKVNLLQQVIASGITEFGENYTQESIAKIHELKKQKNIIWHFIGKVQSNKTKIIAQNFDWCQTIDREKIAILLNKYRPKNLLPMNVLIQINISQEPNKNGVDIQNYQKLADKIYLMPHLNLRGIMAMPLLKKTFDQKLQYQKIKMIFNTLTEKYDSIDTLSLGSSFDIKESLIAGSNMIRIGRSIFDV